MAESIAYFNGTFVDPAKLTIAMNDLGFLMGATISERLRTFGGQLFRWDAHLDRLGSSLEIIGIDLPGHRQELTTAAAELIQHNHQLLDPADDLGLCILVTPGEVVPGEGPAGTKPSVCLYSYPLSFGDWLPWYQQGAALMVSRVRQIPANCWPGNLKCRSRMHYYLADQEAIRYQPTARALLLDQDGYVSEASTANVVIYRAAEGLISPHRSKVLPGISISVVRELAEQLSINWREEDLSVADVAEADEVMLCSTSPCVWAVTEFNRAPIADGKPGPTVQKLLDCWSAAVGVPIQEQAVQFAHRTVS